MEPTIDLRHLWNKRTDEFMKEIRPYLVYALQGAGLITLLLIFAGFYFYTRFLGQVPPGFPLRLVTAMIVFPFLAVCPIRTYIKEADLIYLLPMESHMSSYIQKAIGRAFWSQWFILLAVWLAVWPMFAIAAGGSGSHFLHIVIILTVFKRVLLFGRWTELRMTERSHAMLASLFRWVTAGVLSYLLFALPLWKATLTVSTCLLIYIFVFTWLQRSKSINWLKLMDLEKRYRSFIFRMLNYFIDVPEVQRRARPIYAPKKWLQLLGGVRFNPEHTYAYLFLLVWLRSEWFGMTLRLTALGVLLLIIAKGWLMAGILFTLFAGLIAVQLKELQKAYRHSDWSFVYPLPSDLRVRSAKRVRLRIHTASMIVLCIPALWAMPNPLYALALFLFLWGLSYMLHK